MSDATTSATDGWLDRGGGSEGAPERWVLTITWSLDEPERVGEACPLAPDGVERIFGRGDSTPEETIERIVFGRLRPGGARDARLVAGKGISRDQLRVVSRRGAVHVRRTGRCALRVNGVAAQAAELVHGDVLTLQDQLVLLVTWRPALRRASDLDVPDLGEPDADGMVGESAAMWKLRERVGFVARSDRHVLVLGESGVGKELVARAVHTRSSRASNELVARNAATFPPGLIDAELFGNVDGYPNPGMSARPGVIGQSHLSTLFLDEIGEMASSLQAHLLRVLDGGEYHRLGEARARSADIRLVAGTNRDASELKHDLLGRLPLRVHVPPLRDRLEDVPLLTRHLLRQAAQATPALARFFSGDTALASAHPRIAPELIERLLRHSYPLNVRELDTILWAALGSSERRYVELTSEVEELLDGEGEPPDERVRREPTEAEITAALAAHENNRTRAAAQLGVSRYALYRLLRKHGIS